MHPHWKIQLLGELRVRQPGRSIPRFRTHKTGLLLAYLAFHRDQNHSREHLIELIWPEGTLQAGRNQLSMALSFLRHPLEPPGVAAGAVILADRSWVRLNPDAITTDVADFEAALSSASGLTRDAERAAALTSAVGLYTGDLLPGYYEEWVLGERARLREAYAQALRQLLRLYEQLGELGRALETARAAMRHDPLCEEAIADLLRLYQATGQPTTARRAWRDFERRLLEELGEAPSLALRTLAASLHIEAEETEPEETLGAPRRTTDVARAGINCPAQKPRQEDIAPVVTHVSHAPARSSRTIPSGTVALLLTDIEGSTAQWQQSGTAYASALALHHTLLRQQFARYDGFEIKEMDDGFLVAFARSSEALQCAIAAQQALTEQPWPQQTGAVRVRMALHVGEVEVESEGGDYRGLALHYASRLLSAAHGGQVLCSEAAAVLLRRQLQAEVWLEDVGLYRLRDVPAVQRLFQVSYAGMAHRDFDPPRADRAHSATLPLQLTRFIGRQVQIAGLCRLLLPDAKPLLSGANMSPRLVTVTGPGGVGKTRLALEAAGQLVEPLSGAVFFAGLADVREASRLADALVDALKLARSAQRAPLDQVVEFLGRQPCVLVLDNFEQLLDEENTGQSLDVVSTLLEQVTSLRVLVTSRQRLGLAGEREFRVAPLALPPHGSEAEALTADRLAGVESVALFVDRAQVARADFQLTARNAGAVSALCCGLEGIPLAIELAAVWAQVLTPTQMLRQLQGRFKFLVGRGRVVQARHRTLAAAIDWSYGLLPVELQGFFVELSVFRGGWTLEGAEAVCSDAGDVLDALEYLQRSSLVVAEESDAGEMRFRMLETLREYAAEKLGESGESDAVQERHLSFFLALAEESEPKLTGLDQAAWLQRLEAEHENLRAAMDWSLLHPSSFILHSLRFCGALQRFWWTRGHLSEGREWCTRALEDAGGQERTAERAKTLNAAGTLASYQGDYTSARAYHEEALEIRREIGDRSSVAPSLNGLGYVACCQGDYASARAYFEESLAIHREIGDRDGIAISLNNLASVAGFLADYASARAYIEESLVIKREIGDRSGISYSLFNLGIVACCQGNDTSALPYFEESLAIRREIGDRRGIAACLNNMGSVARTRGDCTAALTYLEESLAIQREIGDRSGAASSLNNLGNTAASLGHHASALAHHQESLVIQREIGDRSGIAFSLECLGNVARLQGDSLSARTYFSESLMAACAIGEPERVANTLDALGAAAADGGALERGVRLWGAAEALRKAASASFRPNEHETYKRATGAAREAMGAEAYGAAWSLGSEMSMEQAAAYALEEAPS